jgi:hypothetical protein
MEKRFGKSIRLLSVWVIRIRSVPKKEYIVWTGSMYRGSGVLKWGVGDDFLHLDCRNHFLHGDEHSYVISC